MMFLVITVLPVRSDLLLYFNFDEAKGDVVADMSGGGHDGTLKEGAEIIGDAKYGTGLYKSKVKMKRWK
jgi:hypothetical protein